MPTFERCDKSVEKLASDLLNRYETHKPLVAFDVAVDYVFAYADLDDNEKPINVALTKGGLRALGITRKISLKDRALGRGDAEIALDGDWWKLADAEQQAALLDHELHHVSVKCDKHGNAQYDDLGRPQLKLRKHDVEVGWFQCIAQRHGAASQERIQARAIMDQFGQFLWPDIAPQLELTSASSKTKPVDAFSKAGARAI